jgi:hypothetical protein
MLSNCVAGKHNNLCSILGVPLVLFLGGLSLALGLLVDPQGCGVRVVLLWPQAVCPLSKDGLSAWWNCGITGRCSQYPSLSYLGMQTRLFNIHRMEPVLEGFTESQSPDRLLCTCGAHCSCP